MGEKVSQYISKQTAEWEYSKVFSTYTFVTCVYFYD